MKPDTHPLVGKTMEDLKDMPMIEGALLKMRDYILRCGFCQKNLQQAKFLIDGGHVYICDECVDDCTEIVKTERAKRDSAKRD